MGISRGINQNSDPGESICPECGRERDQIERLRKEIERLRKELEETQDALKLASTESSKLSEKLAKESRSAKRQAAPFSKGEPKESPKRPGRKPGTKYGRRGARKRPENPDRSLRASLPESCPTCDGPVRIERIAEQYIIDLPEPTVEVTLVEVEVGHCLTPRCGVRVQGRHPEQISDALGAAAVQLGPRLLALATRMKAEMGISYEKIARLFQEDFALPVHRSTLCRGFQRVARKLEPTQDALQAALQEAAQVTADETGWRVAGRSAWLWAFVTAQISFYAVLAGRGFKQSVTVLEETFSGLLVRDGWAPYRLYRKAVHQTCIPHLLRRCHKLLEAGPDGPEAYPARVKSLLKKALRLRDRRDTETISPHGFAVARGLLQAKVNRLIQEEPDHQEHLKLAKHLRNERRAILTFLYRLGAHASNWLAETELRAPISTRKACGGGNRTWNGARYFATILTVVRTARRQGHNPVSILIAILREPTRRVAGALIPEPPAE